MTFNAVELLSGTLTLAVVYIIILHRRLHRSHKRFEALADSLEVVLSGETPRVGGEPETGT